MPKIKVDERRKILVNHSDLKMNKLEYFLHSQGHALQL